MTLPAVEHLPYPIAHNFVRSEDSSLPFITRLSCVADTQKAILKFLVLAAISDYMASGDASQGVNQLLAKRLIDQNLSLGHWLELLRETVRHFTVRAEPPFVRELPSFFFRGQRITQAVHRLEAFVAFRNAELAHASTTPSEAQAGKLYEEQRRLLLETLHDIDFASRYSLVLPEEILNQGDGRLVTRALLCTGSHLPREPAHFTPFFLRADARRGETLLLSRCDDLADHIALYPLLLPEYQLEDDAYDLFSFEGSKRAIHDRLAIRSLLFHSTRVRRSLEVTREAPLAGALDVFSDRFKSLLGEVLGRATHAPPPPPPDHYFHGQSGIIEQHAKSFLGRQDFFAAVQRFMGESAAGYFLLVGPPGQGKTACIASLVHRQRLSHHFFARDGGRNRCLLAMRSIVQQLAEKYQLQISIPDESMQVEKTFSEALRLTSEALARLPGNAVEVIAIDALDESDAGDSEGGLQPLLPLSLPPGVFIVASSRPGQSLSGFAREVPVRTMNLEPLSPEEVRQLLMASGLSAEAREVHALWEATSGNPLFLKVQIEETLRSGSRALTQLRTRLEDCFQARIDRAAAALGESAVLDTIGCLAVAQSGLGTSELAELLPDTPLFTLRRVIAALSEFLVEESRRFRFFHKRFEEYVRKELFSPPQLAAFHRRVIERHQPWSEKRTLYGSRYLAVHYQAASDPGGLHELLSTAFWRHRWSLDGSSADFLHDAEQWLKAGLAPSELLDRLGALAADGEVLLSRKAIRTICDLGVHLPHDLLRQSLRDLPLKDDFWVGSELRKAATRLDERTHAESKKAIRIGVLNYIGHLPLFLAREAGLFEKAGLEVDLLFYDGYEDRVAALVGGDVDGLATTIDEIVLANQGGAQLVTPLRLSMDNPEGGVVDGIVARRPLKSVRELRGLRVAIEKDSPSVFLFHHVLQTHGVPPSDIHWVYFRSSDDAGAALRDDKIDAAVLWEPWLHAVVREGLASILPIEKIDVIEDVLAFNRFTVATHADEVSRLATLWCEVVENLEQNGPLLLKLARDRFGIDAGDYREVAAQLKYAGRAANQDFFLRAGSPAGFIPIAEYTAEVLFKGDLIRSRPDVAGFVPWDLVRQMWSDPS